MNDQIKEAESKLTQMDKAGEEMTQIATYEAAALFCLDGLLTNQERFSESCPEVVVKGLEAADTIYDLYLTTK